jgi:hypothetical protein
MVPGTGGTHLPVLFVVDHEILPHAADEFVDLGLCINRTKDVH